MSEVDERSALIHLLSPECNQNDFEIDPGEFKFELLLSEKVDAMYNMVYSGDATEITLKDLTPANEYHLKYDHEDLSMYIVHPHLSNMA